MVASVLVLGSVLATTPTATAAPPPADPEVAALAKVEDTLERRFANAPGKPQDFLVSFQEKADLAAAGRIADWDERGQAVVTALRRTAETSQSGVTSMLRARGVDFESYWISNAVLVREGTRDVATALAARSEVMRLVAPMTYDIPAPVEQTPASPAPQGVEWGIANINADDVWASGIDGNGIVIGSLDTGVDDRHPTLSHQYRGRGADGKLSHDYNWFDAAGLCKYGPCDNHGHGTHTTGTMVGDDGAGNQIGVAPGAKWIAANGCDPCTVQNLLAAGQWMLAPTRIDGTEADPSQRPHIINNSWGSTQPSFDRWYDDVAGAWDASGIFSVWANGNNGPGCITSGAPGSLTERYSVGAYDVNNQIAGFSSRGAGENGAIKPNIAAPGVNIRSAVPGVSGEYAFANGTSMAAPHVTGAIALLWSATPSLIGALPFTRNLLDLSARDTEDLQCGGTAQNNNVFGEGRLDAQALLTNTKIGTAAGTVTDSSGAPIAGARIELTGGTPEAPIQRTAETGADGTYQLGLPIGEYNATVTAYGFVGDQGSVTITQDTTTVRDFALTAAPMVTVSGRVSDGSGHGWPVHAALTFPGYPHNPVYTDPATGDYSLRLPATEYEVTVDPVDDGYPTSTSLLRTDGSDTRFDQRVIVDPETCTAPGYGWNGAETRFTHWDGATALDGWQLSGKGGTWRFDNPAHRPQPGLDNRFAIADPAAEDTRSMSTTLTSEPVDLSGQTDPVLSFDTRYLGAARQQAAVEYSTDGRRWSPLWTGGSGSVYGAQSVSLAQAERVRIRLTFTGRGGGYWAVDNLFVGTRTCVPHAGGLLVGEVTDESGKPVPGAEIGVADRSEIHVVSREFPDDASSPDTARYRLFVPAGSTRVTATRDGHTPVTDDVTVTRDGVTIHDFQLHPEA
ncbi:hypothetical protein BLA60_17975 [Actinophytocola xinjiangensis]|uniref:Peptidase S8/S53 domain-containing protein n=1 Tax=Actinophytocola xinjiangensis TaxID=485602 RepID=A0A7Z0WKR7_9PSEU|nr:hypothetical protein BLA60_17975 [Actinophytocola xinjiangensis]